MSQVPPFTGARNPLSLPDSVDLIDRKTVFQGYFRIDRFKLRHRRFDGTWSETFNRELFERGHAAAVLLYDPVRDAVTLTEQFRPGALSAGWHPWLIEIVAGIIDAGENAESTAIREAREEAGAEIGELVKIADVLASPGGSSETIRIFCARVDSGQLGGIHGLADESEDIRVFSVPTDEAIAWLGTGRINNATTMLAIQWLALNRDTLRKRWNTSEK